jgi:hypothetical protein
MSDRKSEKEKETMGMMSMASIRGIGKLSHMCTSSGSHVTAPSPSKKAMALRHAPASKPLKVNGIPKPSITFN